jgi:uncharacterized protein
MLRSTLRKLLALDDPPERTALAFSIGVFIAFCPFLGLHTLMAIGCALYLRLNKAAILAGTLINNPLLTLVPIIVASFAIGAFLMGLPISLPIEGLELLKHPKILTGSYWQSLFAHSWDIFAPFMLGGMVLSIACGLIAYPLALQFLRVCRKQRDSVSLS